MSAPLRTSYILLGVRERPGDGQEVSGLGKRLLSCSPRLTLPVILSTSGFSGPDSWVPLLGSICEQIWVMGGAEEGALPSL